MKNIFKINLLICISFLSASALPSCSLIDESTENEIQLHLSYSFSKNGETMSAITKSTNSEIWTSFYQKIISGELMAPSYDLSFTEQTSGKQYIFSGNWADNNYISLKEGTYVVSGTSTAKGDNIQQECSITIDDIVKVDSNSSLLKLAASYDCSLLIVNNSNISRLSNFNGEQSKALFDFENYKYAFIRTTLYGASYQKTAYLFGENNDGTSFKVYTGNAILKKGKYYVYNNLAVDFQIDKMAEGQFNEESDPKNGYVTITYNVTTANASTTIANNVSSFSSMTVDDGDDLSPATSYIFKTNGKHKIFWKLSDPTILGEGAFMNCTSITEANLSNGIETLGVITDGHNGCFDGCSNLSKTNIPNNLITIGVACWKKTSIDGTIIMPSSVSFVGHYAFCETKISSFTFGTGITTTSMCMFQDCPNLTTINSLATTCPPNEFMWKNYSFYHIPSNGILHYPKGSNYSKWLSKYSYWLGYYGWTGIADL